MCGGRRCDHEGVEIRLLHHRQGFAEALRSRRRRGSLDRGLDRVRDGDEHATGLRPEDAKVVAAHRAETRQTDPDPRARWTHPEIAVPDVATNRSASVG